MSTVQERARSYIEKLPPAIAGQGGSTQAFKVSYLLVQGFGLEPGEAAAEFKAIYNLNCVPPFSDAEILRKCQDSLKCNPKEGRGFLLANKDRSWSPSAKSRVVSKPIKTKSKLFVTDERAPSNKECRAIAKSRNLPGPGIYVAATLGMLRVGEMFGKDVYCVGDACNEDGSGGSAAVVRRVDGEPFDPVNGSGPVKSLSLVSGSDYHRPFGFCDLPGVKNLVVVEGAPDYLAAFEQIVWESSIDAFQIDDVNHILEKLNCLTLMMISATSKLDESSSYMAHFAGMDVCLVPHTDDIGMSKARGWFNAIKGFAKSTSVFDCSSISGELGSDFNDVFNSFTRKVLPS